MTRRPAWVIALGLSVGAGGCSLDVGGTSTELPIPVTTIAPPATTMDEASMAGHSTGASIEATGTPLPAVTRQYFIAAQEMVWDYAPLGTNAITGEEFDDDAKVFVEPGLGRVGSKYTKCLYRGFTDATFTTPLPESPQDGPLGLLGPVIRATVGDTIVVQFRNNCSFPNAMHPHGVLYGKDSEGALYDDGTNGTDKADDAVPTGGEHTYTWEVPERAGPGPHDGSSVMWMYMSHTDDVKDTYSGLMGPIVITASGQAKPDGSPIDVDQEIFALYAVMDENQSHYAEGVIEQLGSPEGLEDDEEFGESNLMHGINGYVYGNGPMFTMRSGQRVRWYLMGMGTEVDIHTPHWHGNTAVAAGMRTDVVAVFPGTMVIADMVPDDPGVWLFHCHVADHVIAGMQARYSVTP